MLAACCLLAWLSDTNLRRRKASSRAVNCIQTSVVSISDDNDDLTVIEHAFRRLKGSNQHEKVARKTNSHSRRDPLVLFGKNYLKNKMGELSSITIPVS